MEVAMERHSSESFSLHLFFHVLFLVLSGLIVSCGSSSEQEAHTQEDFQTRQFIVKVKDESKTSQKVFLSGSTGTQMQIGPQLYLVEMKDSVTESEVSSQISALSQSSEIEYIEPDYPVYAFGFNDPQLSSQWAHQAVQSNLAWDLQKGSSDIVVAVIDTGIDLTHQDLKNNLWTNLREIPGNGQDDDGNGFIDDVHGYDFVHYDGDPQADDSPHFHGTHVSGTIAAEGGNGVGGVGQAPGVKVMALKFLSSNGSGQTSAAIQAIDYAIRMGAKIMSNSWGSPQYSRALEEAVERANQAGIVFVAAAGNDSSNNDQRKIYPASLPQQNVITVAATRSDGQIASFSNYGKESVHVAAPGDQILSTQNGNTYGYLSGTSMATPLVSGIAALLLSQNSELTPSQVRDLLIRSSDPAASLNGKVVSGGEVNAYRAVRAVIDGVIPEPTPPVDPLPPREGSVSAPLIQGMNQFQTINPYLPLIIEFDAEQMRGFGATAVYVEFSRPNMQFSEPRGNQPDDHRQTYFIRNQLQGTQMMIPAQVLPGWGLYQIRIIALNSQFQAVGQFSSSSQLLLRPF
ncbi:MAG: hypothetical protein CL678_05140 [Bdellovibrionaceae bacterium]|nr:hypothetical protein [Pseudobdellovibrionaceae bacterium]|tara:strand:+ start:5169 stop:6884 length:1716 start_codon:yes stop_codon:yes gene_type:complete